MGPDVFFRQVLWEMDLAGIDGDAPAFGDGPHDGPVGARGCILYLRHEIDHTGVTDEHFIHFLLETIEE
jgi:hypothetical protein